MKTITINNQHVFECFYHSLNSVSDPYLSSLFLEQSQSKCIKFCVEVKTIEVPTLRQPKGGCGHLIEVASYCNRGGGRTE